MPITGQGEPEVVPLGRVSPQHFEVLGVHPAIGRGFTAAERQPGENRVVVLSHGLWHRRFGADPPALGRTLEIDSEPHEDHRVLARTAGDPVDHADALRAAVWEVDSEVPITEMRPLLEVVDASTAETRRWRCVPITAP